MLCFAGAYQLAISGNHIGRDQIIDRQPELAGGPTEAAAQRKAGDAGR